MFDVGGWKSPPRLADPVHRRFELLAIGLEIAIGALFVAEEIDLRLNHERSGRLRRPATAVASLPACLPAEPTWVLSGSGTNVRAAELPNVELREYRREILGLKHEPTQMRLPDLGFSIASAHTAGARERDQRQQGEGKSPQWLQRI